MAWLSFIILTLFWGCSFLAIRVALTLFPPFAAAGIRIFLAAAILLGIALVRRAPFPSSKSQIFQLCKLGLINFGVAWAALFWGEQFVMPAVASIINSSVPLIVFFLSWRFLHQEQPTRVELLGVALGFLGILCVFVPSMQYFHLNRSIFYGMMAILLMALAYGYATVQIRKMGAQVDVYWSFVFQGFPAALMLFTLSGAFESKAWMQNAFVNTQAWAGILYLAVFSSAIAWILYFKLLHTWGALHASAVTYAMPVVSIVVDWIYFKRLPTVYQLVGAAFILQAIYIMRWAKKKKATEALAEPSLKKTILIR